MPEPQKGIEPLTAGVVSDSLPFSKAIIAGEASDNIAWYSTRTDAETQPATTDVRRTDDLAAVCARHGIGTDRNDWRRWHAWDATQGTDDDYMIEADAVCALLKARWGIATWKTSRAKWQEWSASCGQFGGEDYRLDRGWSELAAVVALADRLAGVTP